MTDTKHVFQKSKETLPGMKTLSADFSNVRARIEPVDHVYTRKNGQNLHVRLIYPDQGDDTKVYPLIVHIQGSGWFQQNLYDHIYDYEKIVTSGYILAIVEYLPIPAAQFPSHVEDAKTAVRYLAKQAEELRIDSSNIFVSGDSSGGHTSLLCWATWNTTALDTDSTEPLPDVKAFLNFYGVTDFTTIADYPSNVPHDSPTSPENLLLGDFLSLNDQEKTLRASVRYYLKKETTYAPLLTMHGNKDDVVPFEQGVELQKLCLELGLDSTFYCIDGAGHGGPAFYHDETVDEVITFLKKHTV